MRKFAAAAAMVTILAAAAACNHGRVCWRPSADLSREPYGATDVNAVSGNQGLSVGVNREGTLTLFKWPNPSYHDQVKYMTTTRRAERLGALANEGVFAGLYYRSRGRENFFWLREGVGSQHYLSPSSVAVRTLYRAPAAGIEVEQTDFVDAGRDVLWRHYRVIADSNDDVSGVRLVLYANLSPRVSKIASVPIADWCFDGVGSSELAWSADDDAFFESREGVDESTGRESAVWLAYGLDRKSAGHQAGYDALCAARRSPADPYNLAPSGHFPGADFARGQVSAGVIAELEPGKPGMDETGFIMAAAENMGQARDLLKMSREQGYAQVLDDTTRHWEQLLARVPLPKTDNQRIREMALRSVIVLLQGFCRDSGAMVASTASQPPYGLDWPRDGAYLNEALLAAGFPDLARRHSLFYARNQSSPENPIARVPSGNWAGNYYADGVPGMPYIWWEIDETAFAVWTLYRYYEVTGDRAYLDEAYPAIRRAADFLVEFRDPGTGLPRPAFENDVITRGQTVRGALCAWFGLKFAVKAAEARGDESSAAAWQARHDELERLIADKFYDPSCERYVYVESSKGKCERPGAGWEHALLIWPAELFEPSGPRAREAAKEMWAQLEPSFTGERLHGQYEPYGLLSLAKVWKGDPAMMKRLERALEWESTVPATDTGHLGEIWVIQDGGAYTGEAQPQLWHHALFYLTALEVYGAELPGSGQ